MSNKTEQKPGKIMSYLEQKISKTNLTDSHKKHLLVTADLIINVVGVIILVVLIRSFIMSPFQVSGISMCDTLNYHNSSCHDGPGDYIIINKSSYLNLFGFSFGTPQRGDIIVFKPPQNSNEFYIKRVIGLPGESIKLIDGFVYIFNKDFPNGQKLTEPYLNSTNQGNTMATGNISEFKVPEGHYFVLGDNRSKSSDSRLCFKESIAAPGCGSPNITPYLDASRIEGKAALEFWPAPQVLNTAAYPELEKKS